MWAARLVHAVRIVNLRWPIDRQSDEKLVARQEFAPCIVKKRSIGLECVVNKFVACVLFLQFKHAFEKRNPEQRRLTTLPCKAHMLCRLRLNVLADVGLQHGVAHAVVAPLGRVEILLFQVIAIRAVKVANRPMRFGHDVERVHRRSLFIPAVRGGNASAMKNPRAKSRGRGDKPDELCSRLKLQSGSIQTRIRTRLLNCRRLDRTTTSANCDAISHRFLLMMHGVKIPVKQRCPQVRCEFA